jgi:hypothetical protein
VPAIAQPNGINKLNSSQKKKKKCRRKVDRFIPSRKTSKLGIALTSVHETDENRTTAESLKGREYRGESQVSLVDMYKAHVLGVSATPAHAYGT